MVLPEGRNLDGRVADVKTILPRISLSASNPQHENCPHEDDSWYKYKKDPETYKHKSLPHGKDPSGDKIYKQSSQST